MNANGFWKVCEALDCEQRIALLRHLLEIDATEFPCVIELAEWMKLSVATVSVHLKKLSTVGLVASKRADRRVYYRAFATTDDGARVIESLRAFFAACPSDERIRQLLEYAHTLSHIRRNAIVRCLHAEPGLSISQLAARTEMPPHTADRLWSVLAEAHVIDLHGKVIAPPSAPETTLLELTLA